MSLRTPSYRHHKARNLAVVTLDGKDHYLGPYGSPESQEKYHRLVAEWLATRNAPPTPTEPARAPLTVSELILKYWNFVQSYYVKDGAPTSEQDTIRQALRFVRRLYGSTPAQEFAPLKLKAVRQAMIDHPVTRTVKIKDPATGLVSEETRVIHRGLARRHINKQIGRIKRMFSWAVEEELVPSRVYRALARVAGLRKGRTVAREKPRIRPVRDEHVQEVLPRVPAVIRTMILVQQLCGGRPQDMVEMKPCDIDRSGPV